MSIRSLFYACASLSIVSLSCYKLPDIFYYSFVSPDQFSAAGHAWVQNLSAASSADRQDILELLLISFERSQSTREVQHGYLSLLEKTATGWNHLVATRRNPSIETNFNNSALLTCSSKDFYALLHEHDCVQNEYALVTERLIVDKEHAYGHLRGPLTTLREDARASVGHALTNSLSVIQQELSCAHEHIRRAAHGFETQVQFSPSTALTRNILDTLLAYAPGVLMKSFIIFDQEFVYSTRATSQAFLISQAVGNFVWHIIECSRAAFYASYYTALYEQMDVNARKEFPHPHTIVERFNTPYACN